MTAACLSPRAGLGARQCDKSTTTLWGVYMYRRTMAGLLGAALIAVSGGAQAQNYPTKPITMIVPFAAGGPTDALARVVAQKMSEKLGQQIVVDNVAGAGGTIGVAKAARGAPDGYTLLFTHMGTLAVN